MSYTSIMEPPKLRINGKMLGGLASRYRPIIWVVFFCEINEEKTWKLWKEIGIEATQEGLIKNFQILIEEGNNELPWQEMIKQASTPLTITYLTERLALPANYGREVFPPDQN